MDLNMAKPSEQKDDQDASGPKVGALLQASRKRLGEELADVALILKIRLPYLIAIEAGRHQELPGATYAVGFIRAYAEHLGLDSEEVVRRFKVEAADSGDEGGRTLSFPTPVPETGIPGGAYVFIGLVLAVLGYGAWFLTETKEGLLGGLVNPLDEEVLTSRTDDMPTTPERPEFENGLSAAQEDSLLAAVETAPILSDDKLVKPEKPKIENSLDVDQAGALLAAPEIVLEVDVDISSEIATEASVEPIVSDIVASSEPRQGPEGNTYGLKSTPILETKVKKNSMLKVKKVISSDEEASKAINKDKSSPKQGQKSKPKKVSNEIVDPVALKTAAEIALPLLSAELGATATLAPIEMTNRRSSRIKINAINNSWIQIRDDNLNTMIVTRLLAAGDSYAVPDQPGLVLLTGNAGALEIVVDGAIVPSIGGLGVVRRGVILEVERLKAGAAVNN
jgi:cytoskeleton protein RodZ